MWFKWVLIGYVPDVLDVDVDQENEPESDEPAGGAAGGRRPVSAFLFLSFKRLFVWERVILTPLVTYFKSHCGSCNRVRTGGTCPRVNVFCTVTSVTTFFFFGSKSVSHSDLIPTRKPIHNKTCDLSKVQQVLYAVNPQNGPFFYGTFNRFTAALGAGALVV